MAWQYQIALECGRSAESAAKCRAFMDQLSSGQDNAFISQSQDSGGNQWVSFNLPQNAMSEDKWEEISPELWDQVASKLEFRFGFCGLEVEQVRTLEELREDENDWAIFKHVALSESIWRSLGSPAGFKKVSHAMMQWVGR